MKKILFAFLAIVAVASIMNSCRKDESGDQEPPVTTNASEVNATISGMVMDETGQPVNGAQVSTGNLSVNTDNNGMFLLKGSVTKNRCVLRFTKAGFLNRTHAFLLKENTVNYIRIALAAEPAAQTVSAAGGTISLGPGGIVQFMSNAFVLAGSSTPYSGTVYITAKHYGVDDSNFGLLIPGGDLAGKNGSGDDVSLYSYGMTSVILKGSSGEDLQLASGTPATITFPIAASQLGNAPASIPLWYLDEETALWKEEGNATKVGNNYVGTVAHFSSWNCDYSGPRSTVNGRAVDCEGIPLANIIVSISGVTVVTDGNGYYNTWIPSGWILPFQVKPQGVIVLPSQVENVGPLSAGQTFTVPDLVVPCGARIYGHIINCAGEPSEGTIVLNENNNYVNFYYSTNGEFNLLGAANVSYSLSAISSTGIQTIQISTPAAGDSIDAGTLQPCSSANYEQGFTITGNGYSNEPVTLITTITSSDSYWSQATGYTIGMFDGFSSAGACNIYMTYQGTSAGTKNLSSNPSEGNFQMTLNGTLYHPSYVTANPFILILTHYGAVGDSIKGNFYGAMKNDGITQEVLISGGKFAFPRTQDH